MSKGAAAMAGALALIACAKEQPAAPELAHRALASSPDSAAVDATRNAEAHSAAWHDVVLSWGDGPAQVGLRPKGPELLADGPSAVAVDVQGRTLVLDRRNRRVLAIDDRGAARSVADVAEDAEDIAVAVDGTTAVWSPLRAAISLRAPDGAGLGELAVPRELREIEGFALNASHRVTVRTSFQETYTLGSPSLPASLPDVLRTRREGAVILSGGEGLAVRRRRDDGGELLVLASDEADGATRTRVRRSLPIQGPMTALRLVGVLGSTACMRVERVTGKATVAVERELVCIDVSSGATVVRAALPAPGIYVPRQEIAIGGAPPSIALIRPEDGGLRVRVALLRALAEEAR